MQDTDFLDQNLEFESPRSFAYIVIRHIFLLIVVFSVSFYILGFSGTESLLVTMIVGGIVGVSYGIVQSREDANPSSKKHPISHLFDHYLENYFFGFGKLAFLVWWLFWLAAIANSDDPPDAIMSNYVADTLLWSLIMAFFIIPILILLGGILSIFDNKEQPQTNMSADEDAVYAAAAQILAEQQAQQSRKPRRSILGGAARGIGKMAAANYRMVQEQQNQPVVYKCLNCKQLKTYSFPQPGRKCCGRNMVRQS